MRSMDILSGFAIIRSASFHCVQLRAHFVDARYRRSLGKLEAFSRSVITADYRRSSCPTAVVSRPHPPDRCISVRWLPPSAVVCAHAQTAASGSCDIEDLDPPREVPGAAEDILATLAAFGMESDEPVIYQSQREAAYRQAFEQLRAAGPGVSRAGAAARTWKRARSASIGACVAAPDAARAPRGACARRIGRFISPISCRVAQSQRLAREAGDFVVRRVEGWFAYQLAVVVDDAACRHHRNRARLRSARFDAAADPSAAICCTCRRRLTCICHWRSIAMERSCPSGQCAAGRTRRPVPALRAALAVPWTRHAARGRAAHPQALLARAAEHFDLTRCADNPRATSGLQRLTVYNQVERIRAATSRQHINLRRQS